MNDIPTKVIAGVTPGFHKLSVVDAATGQPIDGVREADSEAGTLTRSKVDGAGNLVIEDGAFVTVTETRAIRIVARDPAPEPVAPPPTPPTGDQPATGEEQG